MSNQPKISQICFTTPKSFSPETSFGIYASNGHITAITFSPPEFEQIFPEDMEVITEAQKQLSDYFTGKSKTFTLPLSLPKKGFYSQVWAHMLNVHYGETCSYSDLALAAGSPKGMRAVGSACRNNPIPIIVPCHRVLGKNGSLTGYAGGIELKRALLRLEGVEV